MTAIAPMPRFEMGTASYRGASTKIMYFAHVPVDQAVVRVGNYTSIADECTFFIDGNHRFDHASSFPFYELGLCVSDSRNKNGWGKGAPTVGNDVWIGYGATILSGVHIGDGSVVAAKSVVTKDVPAYTLVAGHPAKVVRDRFDPETTLRFTHAQWWDLPHSLVVSELAPLQHDVLAFLDRAQSLKEEEQARTQVAIKTPSWTSTRLVRWILERPVVKFILRYWR